MSRAGWVKNQAAARKFMRRAACPDCDEPVLIFSGGRVVNATHNPRGITHAVTCTGRDELPTDTP